MLPVADKACSHLSPFLIRRHSVMRLCRMSSWSEHVIKLSVHFHEGCLMGSNICVLPSDGVFQVVEPLLGSKRLCHYRAGCVGICQRMLSVVKSLLWIIFVLESGGHGRRGSLCSLIRSLFVIVVTLWRSVSCCGCNMWQLPNWCRCVCPRCSWTQTLN
jgi:hypothetical protein